MSSGQRAGFWGVFHLLSEKGFLPDVYTPFIPDPLQGALTYDVHTEGGRGRPEGCQLIREFADREGGGDQKIPQLCRRHIWKPPMGNPSQNVHSGHPRADGNGCRRPCTFLMIWPRPKLSVRPSVLVFLSRPPVTLSGYLCLNLLNARVLFTAYGLSS